MRAIILAITLGLSAITAKAIPTVTVDYNQSGRILNMQAELWDGSTPLNAEWWAMNGVVIGSGEIFAVGLNGYEIPDVLPAWLVFGDNPIVASYQGQQYANSIFVRNPATIPDSGATAALVGIAIAALHIFRKRVRL
jgi:hypothetical protein